MSRIQEQREQRLQGLRDSAVAERLKADEYRRMAEVLRVEDAEHPLWNEEAARMIKNAEHHEGWARRWEQDREVLIAQYARTEPSEIGHPPTAVDVKNIVRAMSQRAF